MPSFIYLRLCLLLLSSCWGLMTLAQSPAPLALQPHKIQLARRLYRQGVTQKNPMLVAEGYYEYGKLYAAAGDYLNAHRWFIKALRVLEPRGNSYELARLHVRLADLAYTQGQGPESFLHAYKALGIARLSRSNRAMIRSCALLARLHARNWASEANAPLSWPASNADSALFYLRRVHALAYQLNDPMEIAHVKLDIAQQLLARHDPRSIGYFKAALRIATRQKQGDRLPMMLSLASAHASFGQASQAWALIEQARRLIQKDHPNVYYYQSAIEYALIDFYRATKNWKQVALHQQQLHQWEKRDMVADRQGAISRLHLEYQTEKKELQLKAQQTQLALQRQNSQSQQRVILATSTLLVGMVGMSAVLFWLFRQKRRLSLVNAQLVNEQNHRVKNNLQVVSSLLSLQANRLTDAAAQKAIQESQLRVESMAILHRRLYEGDKLVRVELPDFLQEVVQTVLQTYGYGHLQPRYELEPLTVSADQALALGLLINELTTNACKYAFPSQSAPAYRLTCQCHPGNITLLVEDNGPGFSLPGSDPGSSNSFGMRLIQTQARQLRGHYRFINHNGACFTLTFPL
ncbi:sensor histidine kinase [Fibrella forsythiae]|uniref:histidine kinase n=1 Tax=Fibrella forsythiae TaxID=2817061 RepID=A0ABS3JSX0_9BACT|nr:sensor histidine kinase [Fibrella forsythiae]MBO0953105.1 sensor histidine kinase [Fibrella forsythiae]